MNPMTRFSGGKLRTQRLSSASSLATVALLVVVHSARTPLYSQVVAPPTDSLLLEIASTVVRGTPHTHAVWSGGWFEGDFAILIPDGRSFVVVSNPDMEPLPPIIASRPIDGFYRTAYLLPAGHPEAPERSGRRTFAGRPLSLVWQYSDSVFGVKDPLLANAVVLYHEFFHVFHVGRRVWGLSGWDDDPPWDVVTSDVFQALAEREREILARALIASSSNSLVLLLNEYLEVRAERMGMLPTGSRAYETDYERLEGTAHLVGYATGLLAARGDLDDLIEIVSSDLRNTPRFDEPLWQSGPYRDWHVYATGAAIIILLDRLDPTGSWRESLARNAAFPGLLRQALSAVELPSAPTM